MLTKINLFTQFPKRNFFLTRFKRDVMILGIETSCDDTGCAVLNSRGHILGEALESQELTHLKNGGIIPPIAQNLHRQNIAYVVDEAMRKANIGFEDLDAVATTVKPGLPLSLAIGMKYGKYLCRKYDKPFIPIHHMEAHALTCRIYDPNINFPFLVLLISGGHCLISVVQSVSKFLLLGESLDDAPGEAFDKMARRMKLSNIPEFSNMSGGQAIEAAAARATNPLQFKFTIPLLMYRDCNFSMAGIKNQVYRHIIYQERLHRVPPDAIIPDVYNLCAGFQLTVTRHLCHRVQRAMEYVKKENLIPENNQTLVLSGGSACNNFIYRGLKIVCDKLGYNLVRPPPKYCTDNGVMIAWNGIERYKENLGIIKNLNDIEIEKTSPLGTNIIDEIKKTDIKCTWVRLRDLLTTEGVTMKTCAER